MRELIFEKSVAGRRGVRLPKSDVPEAPALAPELRRAAPAELPEVSELDAVRHFTRLSQLNFSVDTHFYPLGSCTMKYNPRLCEHVARLEGFTGLHPLLPQLRGGGLLTQGALAVLFECEQLLCRITGMARFTLQPLAGAHGELTGIMIMAAFHRARGKKRSKVLVPDSSHGTNPRERGDRRLPGRLGPVGPQRPRGPGRAQATARRRDRRPDDDLPEHARPLRGTGRRDRALRARGRRLMLLRRREPQRDRRQVPAGRSRVRHRPPEPAQDLRHAARLGRTGRRAGRRRPRRWRNSCRSRSSSSARTAPSRSITTGPIPSATLRRSTGTSASSCARTRTSSRSAAKG